MDRLLAAVHRCRRRGQALKRRGEVAAVTLRRLDVVAGERQLEAQTLRHELALAPPALAELDAEREGLRNQVP